MEVDAIVCPGRSLDRLAKGTTTPSKMPLAAGSELIISSMLSESGISIALAFLVLRLEGFLDEGVDDWGLATFEASKGMSSLNNIELAATGDLHNDCLETEVLNERPRGAMSAVD